MRARTYWAVVAVADSAQAASVLNAVAALKSQKQALAWIEENGPAYGARGQGLGVVQAARKEVAGVIRRKVFERDEGRCVRCGALVSIEQMHMHERQSRGKGGEISIENSEALCSSCHIGPRGAHGNRRPRFGERVN